MKAENRRWLLGLLILTFLLMSMSIGVVELQRRAIVETYQQRISDLTAQTDLLSSRIAGLEKQLEEAYAKRDSVLWRAFIEDARVGRPSPPRVSKGLNVPARLLDYLDLSDAAGSTAQSSAYRDSVLLYLFFRRQNEGYVQPAVLEYTIDRLSAAAYRWISPRGPIFSTSHADSLIQQRAQLQLAIVGIERELRNRQYEKANLSSAFASLQTITVQSSGPATWAALVATLAFLANLVFYILTLQRERRKEARDEARHDALVRAQEAAKQQVQSEPNLPELPIHRPLPRTQVLWGVWRRRR